MCCRCCSPGLRLLDLAALELVVLGGDGVLLLLLGLQSNSICI